MENILSNMNDVSNDCEILYEKIRKRNFGTSRSTTVDQDNKNDRNEDENSENKYPSYAKEEIELFHKLEMLFNRSKETVIINFKDITENHHHHQTKIETVENITSEDNDSGIELEVVGQSDPDSMECEILWIKDKKILQQVSEITTIESDGEINLEVRRNNLQKEIAKKMEENVSNNDKVKEKQVPSNCESCKSSLTSLFDDLERRLSLQMKNMISQISNSCKKHASVNKKLIRDTNEAIKMKKNRRSCNGCQKIFKRRQDLFNHYVIFHSDERPYQCKLCPNNYKTTYHLKRHVMNIHRIKN